MLIVKDKFRQLIDVVKREKGILSNFSFLTILQIIQLGSGVIVYPYLIKVLGVNNYGIVAYSQAVIGYFVLFVNYGFSITGTREVANNKNNSNELSIIFSTVMTIKIIIFLFCSLLFVTLTFIVSFLEEYQTAYFISLMAVLGWALFPNWFFHGIERMKYITYAMLVAKLGSLILILLFVKESDDFILAILINAIAMLLIGMYGVYKAFVTSNITYSLPSRVKMLDYIKANFAYFFSNICANTKDYANTIILGFVLSYSEVGVYDLIVKLVKILFIPISIFTGAVFPKVAKLKSIKFISKIENILIVYSIIVVVFVFFFAEKILTFFIDITADFGNTVLSFKVMSISIVLLVLTSTRGVLTLVTFKLDKFFAKGIVFSILLYFIFMSCLYLFDYINIVSISFAIVFSIIFEIIAHIYHIKKSIPNE